MVAKVLFVCTANLCRSPMAEAIAAAMWRRLEGAPAMAGEDDHDDHGLEFSSAGTHASVGWPVHDLAAAELSRRGLDLPGFASRQVQAADLHDAALILVATRVHRSRCVEMAPQAVRRCFTLRQLSRFATLISPADLARGHADSRTGTGTWTQADAGAGVGRLLAAVPGARGRSQPVSTDEDDLADPVLGGPAAFHRCARDIEHLLPPILGLIAAT